MSWPSGITNSMSTPTPLICSAYIFFGGLAYVPTDTVPSSTNFAPKLKGKYLTSNVNITVTDKYNQTINVPIGCRFRKFKTTMGRRVTAFGVLFDFTGNSANTTVQKVEDMVKEQWFLEAIQDAPDLFLLAG